MLIPRNKIKSDVEFRTPENSILKIGYGQIPKWIMKDKRLSIEAKAIYSYLCSYAGGGCEAYPTVAQIMNDLQISKDRFYKHMNMLVECKYIIKHQLTDEENKFKKNIYELSQTI